MKVFVGGQVFDSADADGIVIEYNDRERQQIASNAKEGDDLSYYGSFQTGTPTEVAQAKFDLAIVRLQEGKDG